MNIAKLKLADLKKELKDRELPTAGNKAELVARLRDAVHTEDVDDSAHSDEELTAKESELLGEEDDEDISAAELDSKLLETGATSPPIKPKRMIINRESAASAQQAAVEAGQAQAAAAAVSGDEAKTDVAEPTAKKLKLSAVSETERLSLRASKFGGGADATSPTTTVTPPVTAAAVAGDGMKILTAEERKARREARFGAAGANGDVKEGATVAAPIVSAVEQLKKRSERFGEVVSDKAKLLDEAERLKKRKERFGIVTAEDTKSRRAQKFGDKQVLASAPAMDTDKKRARAARFGAVGV